MSDHVAVRGDRRHLGLGDPLIRDEISFILVVLPALQHVDVPAIPDPAADGTAQPRLLTELSARCRLERLAWPDSATWRNPPLVKGRRLPRTEQKDAVVIA